MRSDLMFEFEGGSNGHEDEEEEEDNSKYSDGTEGGVYFG